MKRRITNGDIFCVIYLVLYLIIISLCGILIKNTFYLHIFIRLISLLLLILFWAIIYYTSLSDKFNNWYDKNIQYAKWNNHNIFNFGLVDYEKTYDYFITPETLKDIGILHDKRDKTKISSICRLFPRRKR